MTPLAQGEEMQIDGPEVPKASGSQLVVRREPLPSELETLGIKAGVDQAGMQILKVPAGLRTKANVLIPVETFQQHDPNWKPSLRVVELDTDAKSGPHFYPQQGGRLAPRKQALELLADAAGLVEIRATLLGRERVVIGDVTAETFTHVATAKLRKSDGTLRTLEASRTYEPFAEYEEICTSVASGQYAKPKGTPEYAAEVRKRWLNEIKFAKAKNESKAILRAIRSALQIPHTFTVADAAKPFVVVGWNLAPQNTEAVQAAIAQLYGAAPAALEAAPAVSQDWDLPELVEGELLEDGALEASGQQAAVEAESPSADTAAPGSADSSDAAVREQPPAVGEQGPGPSDHSGDPAPPTPEPEIAGVEPVKLQGARQEFDAEALAAALAVKIPSGSYQSRTIAWVLEIGEPADVWLAHALRQPWPQDPEFKAAVTLAVEAHRPALFAAWKAGV